MSLAPSLQLRVSESWVLSWEQVSSIGVKETASRRVLDPYLGQQVPSGARGAPEAQ